MAGSRAHLTERQFVQLIVSQGFRIGKTRNGRIAYAPDGVGRVNWHSSVFSGEAAPHTLQNFAHQAERAGVVWPRANGNGRKEKGMARTEEQVREAARNGAGPLTELQAALLEEVAREPGLAPKEYGARLGKAGSKQLRWAQAALVKQGRIRAEGATKSRRLFLGEGPAAGVILEEPAAEAEAEPAEAPAGAAPEPEAEQEREQEKPEAVTQIAAAIERYRTAMNEVVEAMAELEGLVEPLVRDYEACRERNRLLTERIEGLIEIV